MIKVASSAIVRAKPDEDVADFLRRACPVVAQGGELFSAEPSIQDIAVLAYKLSGESG